MKVGKILLSAWTLAMVCACGKSNSISGSDDVSGPLPPKGATAYYVDALTGNDEADGTSPGKAWQSLARAGKQALKAGDQLLLRRGQVFRGELDIQAQGTADRPVLVTGYGDGSRPIVSGNDSSMWAVRLVCGFRAHFPNPAKMKAFFDELEQ